MRFSWREDGVRESLEGGSEVIFVELFPVLSLREVSGCFAAAPLSVLPPSVDSNPYFFAVSSILSCSFSLR